MPERPQPDGLIEIRRVERRQGRHFACLRAWAGDLPRTFEIGITRREYGALLRLLELRPLDRMPGVRHRYYVKAVMASEDPDEAILEVHVWTAASTASLTWKVPTRFAANLAWLFVLRSWGEVRPGQLRFLAEEEGEA